MKNFKQFLLTSTLATALILGVGAVSVKAQGPPPGGGGGIPANVPIDGGASLLLAGGVAYGVKKIRERRNSKR